MVFSLAIASLGAEAQSPDVVDLLRREFIAHDFAVRSFGPSQWLNGGESYTTIEPAAKGQEARDIVRYDTATGQREVLVSASQLTPSASDKPLTIENYAWSADMNRVLLSTNSERVWRENTRSDHWVLDRKSGVLRELGAGGPASFLMFAKFSPDGSKVAYLRFNNIYVENVESGIATRLTSDGSEKIINGTADWVYEEEFSVRDGFRWSPDGKRIAYWQFDTTKVKNFWNREFYRPDRRSARHRRRDAMDGSPGVLERQLYCPYGLGGGFRHAGSTASQSVAEHE